MFILHYNITNIAWVIVLSTTIFHATKNLSFVLKISKYLTLIFHIVDFNFNFKFYGCTCLINNANLRENSVLLFCLIRVHNEIKIILTTWFYKCPITWRIRNETRFKPCPTFVRSCQPVDSSLDTLLWQIILYAVS